MNVQLNDQVRAWNLLPDGSYSLGGAEKETFNCQDYFMKEAVRDNVRYSDMPLLNTGNVMRFPRLIQKIFKSR